MKYLLVILLFINIIFIQPSASADMDYDSLYNKTEPFTSKLYNNVDPYEDEDAIKYAWSPYPLFRSAAYLYFKDIKIEPGYYILTPRNIKDKDYILFKQNGKVQHIVPAAKTERTPLNFYEANTPQMKKTRWQKFTTGVRDKFYEISGDSMRTAPPKSFVNVEAEVSFIIVTMYYGEKKYTIIFKRNPY